ncbi:DEAD/DEAH box helicase [Taibaiella lutea]|uniref:DEAD/DEAH box helicase n=1 Tax=Taibaiella lutea TaxID=2608001 RepID=A0A5M6CCM8_9BACT|nr:DEAD/DEAH box helicase [Taibaiella lutea]
MFSPRWYQQEGIDIAVSFFNNYTTYRNTLQIYPTGSGKSVIIANIAKGAHGKTLVLQPSKEILEQNVAKYRSYGFRAGIYSASAGQKYLDVVTFATIGSIAKKAHLFKDVKNIIIDECHLVNSDDGMYKQFFDRMPQAKILGMTATPYRLSTGAEGAELKFLTRTYPRVFTNVSYYVQTETLFNEGHLAKLEYFSIKAYDRNLLTLNSSGTDFTEASIREMQKKVNMSGLTVKYANWLLSKRKNLLVFCTLISEANKVAKGIPGSVVITGETEGGERSRILKDFKSGKIRCVINVGVLTTGFDYPELEAVLMARSTMSLALYYQIIGRIMRPHKDKNSGWFVDLGGNIELFGKIETMLIKEDRKGQLYIANQGKQLTDVPFKKAA